MENFNKLIKNNFEATSSEIIFVVLCACNEPDNARRNKIVKMAVDNSLNWNLVIEISIQQRVLPLIYKTIQSLSLAEIPESITKKIKDLNFNNSTRNLYLLSYLYRVLDLLRKNNICTIPFKGPVLAQDIYGDIGLRYFADLDILVSQKNALKTWEILLKNGFQPQLKLNNGQKQKYIQSEDHMAFLKEGVCVELHWEMSGIYLSHPLTYEHIEIKIRKISIDNREIPNLSPEDLLLYLCVHGAKHGWEHLEQICCITETIKSNKAIDWDLVERLAAERKCQKMLLLGLNLSWFFFETAIPNHLMGKIKEERIIKGLAKEVIECLFRNATNAIEKNITDRFSSFHIRIRDSFSDKIRYILRLTFRSTDKDWIFFPIPSSISFLHYILRPARLIKSGIEAKIKNA